MPARLVDRRGLHRGDLVLMEQTGQSEAIHSPEEWASTVVRLTTPALYEIATRHGY